MFTSWKTQALYNTGVDMEERLYTKHQWKRMDRKVLDGSEPIIKKIYIENRWKEFNFFNYSQTIDLKKRIVKNNDSKITIDNICESLYIINKSAKKSRDTKRESYSNSNYAICNRSKTRSNNLYDIKNKVMEKLIDNNILQPEGYHMQLGTCIELYKYNNFQFHMISKDSENTKKSMKFLGNIDNLIPQEKTTKTKLKFSEAKLILSEFLEK